MAAEILDRLVADLRAVPANAAAIRALRRSYSNQIVDFEPTAVLRLAQALLDVTPAGRFVAYELVQHHGPTTRSITRSEVESLGRGMASWSEVDTFACYISGPAWRARRIANRVIEHWARSSDRWWRRAALVSTVPLNIRAQGGHGDSERTLAICSRLIHDRDDMVVKALSWALRALSQHDADGVHRFLQDHEKELAPRVLREVRNKLTTGLKNPRTR